LTTLIISVIYVRMVIRRYSNRPADTETTSYLLRDIPVRIWKAAKQRAIRDDLDMRAVILLLLERYVKSGIPEESKSAK
jgi:hypothetical protein